MHLTDSKLYDGFYILGKFMWLVQAQMKRLVSFLSLTGEFFRFLFQIVRY